MTLTTSRLTRIALFTALIAVGAFISVPIGAVPITFQNFFVIMAGLLLAPADAFLSVLIYMLLGLIGLPIFAGFRGGLQSVFSPSFGFIPGFAVGAYVIAKLTQGETRPIRLFLATVVGELIFYAVGLPYLYYILQSMSKAPESFYALLAIGVIPFIPGDLFKMVICSVITPKIKKAIK
ncbi:biotin transporter BioY [Peptoniphilus equinus]|uniref:Biotin transporter n=1 Tax=Peptoniphilus equinus TaxID=3016343 RepID=A0ABY7QUL6_9FIRM|nr:biotin transporter BioY [Peptoniphilus equinus]WBW50482.1 biotin transporter BioY [Peptoniphilus equinus]